MSNEKPRRKAPRPYQRGPHLIRRDNGYWYAHAPWCPKGRSLGTRDAAAAQERFAAFVARGPGGAPGGDVGRRVEEPLTEIALAWRSAPHGWTRETLRTQRNLIRAFGRWCARRGVVYPSELTAPLLDEWVTERGAKVSRRTINRGLRAVRSMFAWASAPTRRLCDRNEAVAARDYLREPDRPQRATVPDPDELARILAAFDARADALESAHAAAPHAKRPERRATFERGARLAVAALYGTGLRIAELQRLAPEDIEAAAVHVRPQAGAADDAEPTKGYRTRTIPCAPAVAAAARQFVAWRDAGGHAVTEAWLLRKLAAACTRAGVPVCGLHDLRRAFATVAARATPPVDLVVIARWLGHQRVATTERYVAQYRSDAQAVAPAPAPLLAALRGAEMVRNRGVTSGREQSQTFSDADANPAEISRRGWDSNPRMEVLQTDHARGNSAADRAPSPHRAEILGSGAGGFERPAGPAAPATPRENAGAEHGAEGQGGASRGDSSARPTYAAAVARLFAAGVLWRDDHPSLTREVPS